VVLAPILPAQTGGGPFTSAQSAVGRVAYQTSCASCHLPDLAGRNEASPLAGGTFMSTWGARTTRDLFAYIQAAMPPGNAGGLGQETNVSPSFWRLTAQSPAR
jgi:mono/diheme cytochrome c family protein